MEKSEGRLAFLCIKLNQIWLKPSPAMTAMDALLTSLILLTGMSIVGGATRGSTVTETLILDNGASTQRVSLSTRLVPTTLPVPTFRPTTMHQNMALDIMPNGAPVREFGNNGYAWFDACDTDILTRAMAVGCARVGIRGDRAEFGYRSFDGGPEKMVSISQQGVGYINVLSRGQITIVGLVTAADNTAAQSEGVPVNGLYRTADGTVKVRY